MRALAKINKIKVNLNNCGLKDTLREAELIVSFCLKKDRIILYRDNPVISPEIEKEIDNIVSRRIQREPLQYIFGYTDFCDLKIKVMHGVLIPRPETELLVEESIKIIKKLNNKELKVLDLCTGTGCIAIAIAKKLPEIHVYATDISNKAIKCARENAEINHIKKNVIFMEGNLFETFKDLILFDIIISNPPYIKTSEIESLQPEVSKWEPYQALDGGKDGLKYYKEILKQSKKYLKSRGFILFEIGEGQVSSLRKIVKKNGFNIYSILKDFSGIERVVIINSI